MKSWAVVVPSNRPDQLGAFRKAWAPLLQDYEAELIVVHDNELGWETLPWFVPRQTDMIRSAGMIAAWKARPDYVLTVDDDTIPAPKTDLFAAYEDAFDRDWPLERYLSVGALTDAEREMRGFPYRRRGYRAGIQYGGWHGVPDYDAETQLARAPVATRFHPVVMAVPHGCAVTGSAMNCAWRTELTPLLWQFPLFDGRYKRFGDIWSGLVAKKVADHCGLAVLVNGEACVSHRRASNAKRNAELEAPGRLPNEDLWLGIGGQVLLNDPFDMIGTYREVTDRVAVYFDAFDPPYAEHFLRARDGWLDAFS